VSIKIQGKRVGRYASFYAPKQALLHTMMMKRHFGIGVKEWKKV